jgi:hypothetical protein
MVRIYCGTNEVLPDGYDEFGTRYRCLRKGVGVGLHLVGRPRPIGDPNRPKLYCGTREELPEEYEGFATPYQCLRKGVGVGLWLQN